MFPFISDLVAVQCQVLDVDAEVGTVWPRVSLPSHRTASFDFIGFQNREAANFSASDSTLCPSHVPLYRCRLRLQRSIT